MKRWLPLVVGVVAAVVCGAIAYWFASGDIGKAGDWRSGAQRFIGFAAALGLVAGYVVTAVVVRGIRAARGGFTLSYPKIVPRAESYRQLSTLVVGDLVAALRAAGYEPAVPRATRPVHRAARSIRRRCSPAATSRSSIPASAAGSGSSCLSRARPSPAASGSSRRGASAARRPRSWRCS